MATIIPSMKFRFIIPPFTLIRDIPLHVRDQPKQLGMGALELVCFELLAGACCLPAVLKQAYLVFWREISYRTGIPF